MIRILKQTKLKNLLLPENMEHDFQFNSRSQNMDKKVTCTTQKLCLGYFYLVFSFASSGWYVDPVNILYEHISLVIAIFFWCELVRRHELQCSYCSGYCFLSYGLISSKCYAGVARLGAKCLSAIHAYDCTLEQLDIESAQSKFDDILNSSSLEDACDKIKSLAKAKELDSSLILLINRAWAAAKDYDYEG